MKKLLAALALLLVGVTASAVPVHVTPPKRDPARKMATVGGTGLDASLLSVETRPDGSAQIVLAYKNGAGQQFTTRALFVPADRTKPITDNRGQQVSAGVPSALGTAIDSFNAQLNSMLTTAASAGKLDL